jgi:uncharacterized UPF0160 family protein
MRSLIEEPNSFPSLTTIVTHSGPFHADDVVAAALISLANGSSDKLAIVRTRDTEKIMLYRNIDNCWIVDVGGECSGNMLDHHFSGAPVRVDTGVPYASAGLAFRSLQIKNSHLLKDFILAVDKADNAITQEAWEFSSLVSNCNPLGASATPTAFNVRFHELVVLVRDHVLSALLDGNDSATVIARFKEATSIYVSRNDADKRDSIARVRAVFAIQRGPVLELDRYEVAAREILHEAPPEFLFYIFPSPDGHWMVQQIPEYKSGSNGRKSLPLSWIGKQGSALDAAVGMKGCIFVHSGGFIGSHSNRDGARRMGELAGLN